MNTTPYWSKAGALPQFPKLGRNLHVDVVIVGGGITGITAAYLLKKSGVKIALVERRKLGGVDTAHTTAHLTQVTDKRLPNLISQFGENGARLTWEAGGAAIDQIVKNIREEEIESEFNWVPGYLHSSLTHSRASDQGIFQVEARLADRLGFQAEFGKAIRFFKVP